MMVFCLSNFRNSVKMSAGVETNASFCIITHDVSSEQYPTEKSEKIQA